MELLIDKMSIGERKCYWEKQNVNWINPPSGGQAAKPLEKWGTQQQWSFGGGYVWSANLTPKSVDQ